MTPDEMYDAILRNLSNRTGKTFDEWVAIVRSQGPPGTEDRVRWLTAEHAFGNTQARVVIRELEKPVDYRPATHDELLDAQYAGSKAALKAIYDRVAQAVSALGPDARLDARNTYVSMIRRRQFGLIQASTRKRVDVGLRMPGARLGGRLADAGNLGSESVNCRVALVRPEEVDDEFRCWLHRAYDSVV